MGWARCGKDSQGRPIGYAYSAICDHPGCNVEIDRGLSYACGGMHGEDTYSCEKYFCAGHLSDIDIPDDDWLSLCAECIGLLELENEGG